MSIPRRRLISNRAIMTSIIPSRRTDLRSFVKGHTRELDIEDLLIVCVDTSNKSKQVHITFEKGNDIFYKINLGCIEKSVDFFLPKSKIFQNIKI